VEQTKYVEEPEYDADDHESVQDRLDTACHRNETIHKPKQDAHNDQGYENLHKRHSFSPFCPLYETLTRESWELRPALPSSENSLNLFDSLQRWTADPSRPCDSSVVRCPPEPLRSRNSS
jgi:hypothetical protein